MNLLIITPVRNEEQYLPFTIACMLAQTRPPLKWVIVDDGSSDGTGSLIESAMARAPFIERISLPDRGYRQPGQGVVETFYKGFDAVRHLDHDVVAKLDGDLEFPPQTLEAIGEAFQRDPKLGITGLARCERRNEKAPYVKEWIPTWHVAGSAKFYRKACFEAIGGLIPRAGWDGVDTVRANLKGWKTGVLGSLTMQHLRPAGTADGESLKKACRKYGDVSYYMGGALWYFLLRVILRSVEHRDPRVGYHMIRGYWASFRQHMPRETGEFRRFLKRMQMQHFLCAAGRLIPGKRRAPAAGQD